MFSLARFTKIYAAVALLSVSCLIAVSLWIDQERRDAITRQISNTELQLSEERLSHALIDRETGFRGYILSLDQDFLLPFREADKEVERLMAKLKPVLPADDWESINSLIEERTLYYRDGLDVVAKIDSTSLRDIDPNYRRVINLVRSGEGREYTLKLRETLERISSRANAAAELSEENRTRLYEIASWLNWCAYLVLIGLVIAPVFLVSRYIGLPISHIRHRLRRLITTRQQEITLQLNAPSELQEFTQDLVNATDELLKFESQLSEQFITLEKGRKEKEQLYDLIGHELVTPTSVLRMLIDKLKTQRNDDKDLETASREVDVLLGVLRRLSEVTGSARAISNIGDQADQSALGKATANASISSKRILFVEDTPTLRLMGKAMLEKAGAEVEIAPDGHEALAVLEQICPDLVLTDILMPNMDGIELTSRLRREGYTSPIIGITASTAGTETQQLLESGADRVLAKPLVLSDLEAVLAELK